MVTTLCLFTCALATAQPASSTEWLLRPQLGRGQELVYTGSYTEEVTGRDVRFQRAYHLESRLFVVDTQPTGFDVALMTVLHAQKPRGSTSHAALEATPCSLRMEMGHVDTKGKLTLSSGQALTTPLDGPATLEGDIFAEVTRNYVTPGQTWTLADAGRPPRTWRVIGGDMQGGVRCVKVICTQQSADWDHPRADRTAWRRRDTLWILPSEAVASRVERVVEKRAPARLEPTQRSVTTYDLRDSLVYPRQLFEDRYQEIRQARTFAALAEPLLREPGRYNGHTFDVLLDKISFFLDNHAETPYRVAIRQVQHNLDAARRGDAPAVVLEDNSTPPGTRAIADQIAPDFVTRDLRTQESVHFNTLRGHCLLLIFFSPNAATFNEVCAFGRHMHDKFGRELTVIGLTVGEDADALKQWRAKKLSYALLAGDSLRLTYGVETTPKLVVVDSDGIIRGAYLGWGREMSDEIATEIRRAVLAKRKP